MKKIRLAVFFGLLALSTVLSCKDEGASKMVEETMTAGSATFYVDDTLQPIAEDVIAVFSNMYSRASISQVNKSEAEIIKLLLEDDAGVAILPRKLTKEEEAHFRNKKIESRVTEFGIDAIAFITNNKAADTLLKLEDVLSLLQGEESKISKLVFDNPNSGTVQELLKRAGVSKLPSSGVHAVRNNQEVIKYIHDNDGAIGVIGIDWVLQSPPELTKYVENIQVLSVNNVKKDGPSGAYYKPNQSNIATGSYPLTRKLYVLNYQGKQGLGMGFANFISAPDGQRIILKSGLMPANIPNRELEVRNKL